MDDILLVIHNCVIIYTFVAVYTFGHIHVCSAVFSPTSIQFSLHPSEALILIYCAINLVQLVTLIKNASNTYFETISENAQQ